MSDLLKDIIQQGKSVSATDQQKQDLEVLFHQPELEFEVKKQLLDDLNSTPDSGKDKAYFDDIFEKFWSKRTVKLSLAGSNKTRALRLIQWAAILIFGLFLGYSIQLINSFNSPVYCTSVAPKGSISELFLADGTQIYLNSGSQIRYPVNSAKAKREVFLSGEAFFDVAKKKGKPFLVHTSAYDVKVMGTKFNVKAYPEEKEVSTTLEEGSVHITSSENLELANETAIKPGEQAVYNSESGKIRVAEVNTKVFTAWTDNKLVFVNMSLKDLKVLLERKYGVKIDIQDSGVLDYHYDGTLKNETILQVMQILEQTLPIHYQIVGQKIVISKK